MSASEAGESESDFAFQEDEETEARRLQQLQDEKDDLLTVTDFEHNGFDAMSARKSGVGMGSIRAASDAIHLGLDDDSDDDGEHRKQKPQTSPQNTAPPAHVPRANHADFADLEDHAKEMNNLDRLANEARGHGELHGNFYLHSNSPEPSQLTQLAPANAVGALCESAFAAITCAAARATAHASQNTSQNTSQTATGIDYTKAWEAGESRETRETVETVEMETGKLSNTIKQAEALSPPSLLTRAHVEAAGRAFQALHPAARHLFAAVSEVRCKTGHVFEAAVNADVYARAAAIAEMWEGAMWVTADCCARVRGLDAQGASWRAALLHQMTPKWEDLKERAFAELAQWKTAFTPYLAALQLALEENNHDMQMQMQIMQMQTEQEGQKREGQDGQQGQDQTEDVIETLRQMAAKTADAWLPRDTALRALVLQQSETDAQHAKNTKHTKHTKHTQNQGQQADAQADAHADAQADAVSRIAASRKRLLLLDEAVQAARRKIIDAQEQQLQRLLQGVGTKQRRGHGGQRQGQEQGEGLLLATEIAQTAAFDAATEARIEDLVSARQRTREELEAATEELQRARTRIRARAAATLLNSSSGGHRRWLALAQDCLLRAARFEQEAAVLRAQTKALSRAVDEEVVEAQKRICAQANRTFEACTHGVLERLRAALEWQAQLRSSALQPLTAAETALRSEMQSLVTFASSLSLSSSSSSSSSSIVSPSFSLVDDAMRAALQERVAAAQVVRAHDFAARLQNISDTIRSGLTQGLPTF